MAATDGVLMVQLLVASEPAPDAVLTAASKAAAAAVVTRFLEAGGLPALLQVAFTQGVQSHDVYRVACGIVSKLVQWRLLPVGSLTCGTHHVLYVDRA